MLRKASEAVSEGNGPVHQEEKFGFGQPAPVEKFRDIRNQFDKLKELMGRFEQYLLSQEHEARQPRLAMEADGPQTPRLKSARRAPLKQYKRCVGIAVLLNKIFKIDRRHRSLSA